MTYDTIKWEEQHRLAIKLSNAQKARRYYFIDIVGTCNLKCPSCAVGNMPALPKGTMSYERLSAILQKISDENPAEERIFVDLYNWGEPLLHPDIGRMIRLVREHGFGCGVSTNLVFGKYLPQAVAAVPDYIRISLSGYDNAVYKQTHVGGDANLVKANMHRLRYELDRLNNSQSVAQVGFHIYRTNFPDDFKKMLRLTDELGFLFSPTIATIMPVEKSVAVLEGGAISAQDETLLEKLVIHPKRWEEINLNSGIPIGGCQYKDARTTINFDGSVSLCCAVYDTDKRIADDFTQTSDAELAGARRQHQYCGTCMEHRLHHVYTGIRPDAFWDEAARVLGSEYTDYREASRLVGDRGYIIFDGKFRTIQSMYDAGMEYLRQGDNPDGLSQAERHFDAIVEWAPWFAEGVFQSAAVKKRMGNYEDARKLAKVAWETVPDNPAYQELACSLI